MAGCGTQNSTPRSCDVEVDLNPEPPTQPAQHGMRKVDEEGVSAAWSFTPKHLLQVGLSCPSNSVGCNVQFLLPIKDLLRNQCFHL